MSVSFRAAAFGLAFLALAPVAGAAPATPGLPFMKDDYARAIQEARARKVPIFIEAWAPW